METTIQKAKQGVSRYLEIKGYEILEDGWCHGKDSVDFIATDEDDALVFIDCEVNANASEGIPEEAPDRKAFERIAAAYLAESDMNSVEVRYDIVGEGVIDEGYDGEIVVKLYNLGRHPKLFQQGDKIIQLLVMPVLYPAFVQADDISGGERGSGGFGSTGR